MTPTARPRASSIGGAWADLEVVRKPSPRVYVFDASSADHDGLAEPA